MASAAGSSAPRAGGSRGGRGLLRRAGRRAVRDPRRGDPPVDRRPWAGPPGSCLERRACRRGPAASARSVSLANDDLRGTPRSACRRRDRQHLAQRDAVRGAHRSLDRRRSARRRDDRASRRHGSATPPLERRRTPGAGTDARLREIGPTVFPLWDARSLGAAEQRDTPNDLLVPVVPTGARAVTWTVEVRCAGDRHVGWTCFASIRDGDRTVSEHEIRLAPADLARFAPAATDPTDLVERSLEFLLEREPPTSILRTFDLTVI